MRFLFPVLVSFLILQGCGGKNNESKIIAKVNDEVLTEETLNEVLGATKSLKEKRKFVENWIDLTALSLEADNLGLSDNPIIINNIQNAEKKIKANAFIAQKIASINISEAEMLSYYRVNENKYKSSAKEYKIQRIVVKTQEKLNEVKEAMKNGLKFTATAKQFSEEEFASNGGYTGFMGEKDMSPIEWTTVKELKKWHYKTINTPKGHMILRHYESRITETIKSFADVKDGIKRLLIKKKESEIYNNLLKQVKQNTQIEKKI